MDSKEEACTECTRSCLSLHKTKRDPYPIVSSFFKVMFGKQFGEELIVPPKFAKTIQSLEGKNTCLEDSTGQKWDVRLSKVNGSLIFQRGWQEFSKDHGIELGDFVVFHYIRGSHFIVQTFTRTGCERSALFCDKNYQNKRRKSTRNSVPKGDSDGTPNTEILPKVCSDSRKVGTPEVDSVRRQDNVRKSVDVSEDCLNEGSTHKKPKVAPAEDFVAEPNFMTGRTTSSFREDDRDHLFDLSAFEMPTKKEHIDETNVTEVNRCPQGSNQSQNAQIGTASVDVEKSQIAETSSLLVSDVARVPKEEPISLSKSSSEGTSARMITKEQRPCENDGGYWVVQTSRCIPTDHENFINLEVPSDNSHDLGSRSDKVATDVCFLSKTVNPEPTDFCDSTSSVMIKSTCSAIDRGEAFLELPECLPIKICRQGAEIHKKLIKLLDPTGIHWPVVYQEKKGVYILTIGWKGFWKSNNIQPGDQCTFVLEDKEKCIFKVDILRK